MLDLNAGGEVFGPKRTWLHTTYDSYVASYEKEDLYRCPSYSSLCSDPAGEQLAVVGLRSLSLLRLEVSQPRPHPPHRRWYSGACL